MADLILVTGSRSLQCYPEAEARARAILRHALSTARLLVVGGASGPDTWARGEAAALGVASEQWRLDGWAASATVGHPTALRKYGVSVSSETFRRWHLGHVPLTVEGRRSWPLVRNRAMVEWASKQPGSKLCLAFVDRESRTSGTAHTARLAREAGIPTVEMIYG